MTKTEIIEELFDNYYVKYPWRRAVDSHGNCQYKTHDKVPKYCAVGKCLTKSGVKVTVDDNVGTVSDFYDVESEKYTVEPFLKKKYKGHSEDFWEDMQVLHDSEVNWDDKGITQIGKEALERLKKRYA